MPREHIPDGTEPDHGERIVDRSATAHRLAQLPPKQRAVLVLRYLDDLTDPEIAAALGCCPATVRAYAARGLATLRATTVKDAHVR